jgi:hypothetical protein
MTRFMTPPMLRAQICGRSHHDAGSGYQDCGTVGDIRCLIELRRAEVEHFQWPREVTVRLCGLISRVRPSRLRAPQRPSRSTRP